VRRVRRVTAALLVVVTSCVITTAVVGVWSRNTALDTDRWVRTVGPLAEDPAVQEALGSWVTDEIMRLIDVDAYVERVLPDEGGALAGPLAVALRGFVGERVDTYLASDTFDRLWRDANRQVHRLVVAVLEGDTDDVRIEGDRVEVNLVPVVNAILADIADASPEILGVQVDLPTVTVDEVPEEAIERIEAALGREVPDDLGQFTVFEAQRLNEVQDAVSLFEEVVELAVVASGVLVVLTLGVSPRRRRTMLQLCVGVVLGVVFVRRIGLWVEGEVVAAVDPDHQDATRVVAGAFVSSLADATTLVAVVVTAVAAVALVTGPYGWATASRRRAASLVRGASRPVRAAAPMGDGTGGWGRTGRDVPALAGVVTAIVILLVVDLSWWGIVVLGLVLGAFELVVGLLGASSREQSPRPG
jgi:hypothetical protein